MTFRPLIVTLSLLSAALILAAVFLGYRQLTRESAPVEQEALIGGPFTLTNHLGQTVTEADFAGRPMLIFFGYSYCPDICPLELQSMTQALTQLEARGINTTRLTPIFITVDPERDTVDVMAEYVAAFHPRLVGLTGTPEQIREVASVYRVYYAKAPQPGAEPGDMNYLMDHSAITYLMDSNGRYAAHFSTGTPVNEMADGIAAVLAN